MPAFHIPRAINFICLGFFISSTLWSQDLQYYLPQDIEYDSKIPTPASVIGHSVGEWHVSHDKLVHYMEAVTASSDRVIRETYGYTYEGRSLMLLTFTSPENHQNLELIRKQHSQLSDPSESARLDIANMPVVVWMGYSVHGNEASGTNASLLAAYYLAAAQGPEIEELLDNAIILIDPSINPDGMNRFASWVNSHRSKNLDGNPNNLEHNESWPKGRTNHYWFDLNRDWLPLQHPESKGRIEKFHYWKPNVLTDHHEMGAHRTFFFQPGVPSRNHPLTPDNTYKLTALIAAYHAKALDKIGSLYYSQESYDDFYYGKGSTYPDINGSVGILFEQASARGHLQDTDNGALTFPFAIKNQFTTTLSTMQAAKDLRTELLEHQRNFYSSAIEESNKDHLRAYIFQSRDHGRMYHFLDMIKRHQIDVYHISQNLNIGGTEFSTQHSYIIPLRQRQYRLIKALFEQRTEFQDSLFYDVSAWTLPLAYNLDFSQLDGGNFQESLLGEYVEELNFPKGQVVGGKSLYAYVFECREYYSYRAMNHLLNQQLRIKVATENMILESGVLIPPGSVIIPVAQQELDPENIYQLMQVIAENDGVTVRSLSTGFSSIGKSWGSPTIKPLTQPKVVVLADDDINGYEVGEVWHLLDQRFDVKMTMVSQRKFAGMDLNEFNALIMVSGQYRYLSNPAKDKIKQWIENGGQVICWKTGAKWLTDVKISTLLFEKNEPDTISQLPYGERNRYTGARKIGGAIFKVKLDLTHPLTYGMEQSTMPIFRNSELIMKRSKNPFTNPIMYTSDPLMSGYIHAKKLEELKNTPVVGISHVGKGRIVAFTDNPNFRAFWLGTNKLFLNALFFGSTIEAKALK